MAKIKYAAGTTPINSEHDGFTFQNNLHGSIMFPAQKNDRKRRTNQWDRMQCNQKAIRLWPTLTLAQKTAWDTFAATYPQPTKKDETVFLTGYQLFLKRNSLCFLSGGLDVDPIIEPVLESLPGPSFSIEITQSENVIDLTDLYIRNFGILPEPGQFVICQVLPMSVDSGQIFPPYQATIEVINTYMDGLFASFTFSESYENYVFMLYLSKVIHQSVTYAGTKFRYMGCFKPTSFIQLTDTPSSYTGQADKVVSVKPDESGLEFTTPGGGGLTCEDLANCPTIQNIQAQLTAVSEIVSISNDTSVPPVSFGLLYNWFAIINPSSLFAAGWRAPTKADADALVAYCGGSGVAGGILKQTGFSHWQSPNTGAVDSLAFHGVGGGYRTNSGSFQNLNLSGYIRTSTSLYYFQSSTIGLVYSNDNSSNSNSFRHNWGGSIRAMRDVPGVADGTIGTYVGNDGKVYRTVVINEQEWTADNLAETAYSDGTSIPEITDNAAWGADTAGALCAYNNDWANV